MPQLLARRAWLILGLAVLAGLTAFVITRGGEEAIYEERAVFVLRPSAAIEDAQIPDAIRGIAQQDSQLIHTVSRVIETEGFLQAAFEGIDREIDPAYDLRAAIIPGSDVVEVSLRGPDRDVLRGLAGTFAAEATEWVDSNYRAYSFDLLELVPSDGPISASPNQTIMLAALLGLLIGIGVVTAEHKALGRRTGSGVVATAAPSAIEQDVPSPEVVPVRRAESPRREEPLQPRRRSSSS